MQVRFWGTRGSFAKPGPSTVRYGGNTSCVEVRTKGGTLLVLDCGTGAHELGQHLQRTAAGPIKGNLLISHTHWDHIQGIPFFAPFFVPGNEWDVYAPQGFGETLRTTLAGQMEYTYFPITPEAFGAKIQYHNVTEGMFQFGDIRIRTRFLNHPALTIAYRIEADGAAIVYACDHEPHSREAALGGGEIEGQDEQHADFLRHADLVIHDAQYTASEYPAKAGWGHSTFEYAVAICERAGVRRLALTHHDPMRDDEAVDRLLAEARARAAASGKLEIVAAAEGMIIEAEGSGIEATSPIEPVPSDEPSPQSGQTLVVVTTDGELRRRVEEAVRDEGFGVVQADDLSDAVELIDDTMPPILVIDGAVPGHTLAALTTSASRIPTLVIGGERPLASAPNLERISADFSREYLRSRLRTWLLRGKFGHLPACIPEAEAKRLSALRSLHLLDTPPEGRFDRFTRIAAQLFNVPISLISLVDENRQWFKSKVGLDAPESPRQTSFCAHAILEPKPLVIPDALADERFANNPLVTGKPRIRFYAGVPIRIGGEAIGTLCLIDTKPREPSEEELRLLEDMGALVQQEMTRPRTDISDKNPLESAV